MLSKYHRVLPAAKRKPPRPLNPSQPQQAMILSLFTVDDGMINCVVLVHPTTTSVYRRHAHPARVSGPATTHPRSLPDSVIGGPRFVQNFRS